MKRTLESQAGAERITNENALKGRKNAGFGHGCAWEGPEMLRTGDRPLLRRSGRLAMVEIQQTAEPLAFFDVAGLVRSFSAGKGDDVVDPLVGTFPMIMGHVFVENVFERLFSEKDYRTPTTPGEGC